MVPICGGGQPAISTTVGKVHKRFSGVLEMGYTTCRRVLR